jgi:hypothetical protein
MRKSAHLLNRRRFIKNTAGLAATLAGLSLLPQQGCTQDSTSEGLNVIGPREGFSPHVGTLVSMMDWMRMVVISPVKNMTVEQLDYQHDLKSNSIGAMLLHLAATERYYQLNTFEGRKWGSWNDSIKKQWDVAMNLGEAARKTIRGNNLEYYLSALTEVRENSHKELRKRDDKWLLTVDKGWSWGPTNNYCKWFHVVEHESNHNGQIKWIKSRVPGAQASND